MPLMFLLYNLKCIAPVNYMNITRQRLIECIFSPVPVYKITDQVQRLSYVDQLCCVFSIFTI